MTKSNGKLTKNDIKFLICFKVVNMMRTWNVNTIVQKCLNNLAFASRVRNLAVHVLCVGVLDKNNNWYNIRQAVIKSVK